MVHGVSISLQIIQTYLVCAALGVDPGVFVELLRELLTVAMTLNYLASVEKQLPHVRPDADAWPANRPRRSKK
ncbi:hypothetical protein JT358_08820 [Micrococcales bacterium 31B]|nr:hypothetical protein [Micrococcales bacterium 31B]